MKRFLFAAILLFSTICYAQLPVRNEPRHHNVFENDYVRVLDVFIGPHDTTLYHLHKTPSVFIVYTSTKAGSQLWGQAPQEGINVSGEVSYDSLAVPRLHRVWNKDTSWFHVMDVELTAANNRSDIAEIKNPFLKLLFNQKQVNGYSIELKPSNTIQLPASANGYLLISKNETEINYQSNAYKQHRVMKAGHYIWVEGGKQFSVATLEFPASLVLLQFK
jgi:hypothetical protein